MYQQGRKLFFLLGIALIAVLACNKEQEAGEMATDGEAEAAAQEEVLEVTKAQFQQAAMVLDSLQFCPFSEVIEAKGYLEVPPSYRASVSLLFGGYIEEMDILPGQWIKKGAVLFSVRNPVFVEMQQEYLELKEQLVYLKDNYERLRLLTEEHISARKDFVKAESEYKSALARKQGLETKLRMLGLSPEKTAEGKIFSTINVYAPISGFVSDIEAHKGMWVEPRDEVLSLANTSHLHLELKVFEEEVYKLKKGQDIRFHLQGNDTEYEAEVHLVGKEIEGEERSVRVHGHIKGEVPSHFVPGMYIQANIISEEVSRACLPEESVVFQEDEAIVLVLEGMSGETYRFRKIKVQAGERKDGRIAILNPEALQGKMYLKSGGFQLIR